MVGPVTMAWGISQVQQTANTAAVSRFALLCPCARACLCWQPQMILRAGGIGQCFGLMSFRCICLMGLSKLQEHNSADL